MDNFKIKLSDIFKYILLGLTEVIIFVAVIGFDNLSSDLMLQQIGQMEVPLLENQDLKDAVKAVIITVVPIATLVLLYVIGYLTQSIILLLYGGRFLGTGIYEVAQFIRHNPRWLSKEDKYPDWVHWSDCPGSVINAYKEHIEVSGQADDKAEFLYASQLFQGISFALVIASLYSYGEAGSCKYLYPSIFLVCLWGVNWLQKKCTLAPYIAAIITCSVVAYASFSTTRYAFSGLLWAVCLASSLIFAILLARVQIQRFGIMTKDSNDSTFGKILGQYGMPKAYILVRAHQICHLEESLNSIAKQDYPNIKVLLLIDNSSADKEEIIKLAGSYKVNIVNFISTHTGPAALAYEIRELFLKNANDDDISIMLDSDDLFYSEHTVSRIMAKIYRTGADVCLLTFEVFGEISRNYSRNTHNEIIKGIALERSSWTPTRLNKEKGTHRISTIGWTKCYRKHMVKFYQELLSDHYSSQSNNGEAYDGHTKYEDFPDIINLLRKETRICAVEKTSILFRKRQGSTTTGVSWDNYGKQIPYFLNISKQISSHRTDLIKNAEFIITNKLIPYKFVQYYKILCSDSTVQDTLMILDKMPSESLGRAFVKACNETGCLTYGTLLYYLSDENKGREDDLKIFNLDINDKIITNLKKIINDEQNMQGNKDRQG